MSTFLSCKCDSFLVPFQKNNLLLYVLIFLFLFFLLFSFFFALFLFFSLYAFASSLQTAFNYLQKNMLRFISISQNDLRVDLQEYFFQKTRLLWCSNAVLNVLYSFKCANIFRFSDRKLSIRTIKHCLIFFLICSRHRHI